MKTLLLTLSLLTLSIKSAQAQDLIYTGSGSDGSNYSVDRQFMKYYPKVDLVGFIYTNRLREPNKEGVLFTNYSVLANCKTKSILVIGGNSYNENYKMISSKKFTYKQDPSYGSPNYNAVVKVCDILGDY